VTTGRPLDAWKLPKEAAIEMLPEDEPPGAQIRAFYASVRAHYMGERSVESALEVIKSGTGFLRVAWEWYGEFGGIMRIS
jgi:hypothetical protein